MNEAPQERDGQVSEQVKNLILEIDRLGDLTDQLCKRLTIVTRAPATSDAVAEEEPKQQLVPLAGELRNLSEKIGHVNCILNTLCARIEL